MTQTADHDSKSNRYPEIAIEELERYLASAVEAAKEAGSILLKMLGTAAIREKGEKDLVTDADIAAQKAIRERLLGEYPSHAWVGEEDAVFKQPDADRLCWVVDPLDGTANYAHSFPNFAVSIGLVQGTSVLVGVVYDPCSKELYSAIRGSGAHLNGQAIQVSGQTRLDKSLIAASFPPNVRRNSVEVEEFLNVLERSQSVRRLGSAALNLCYVACGRIDGYWTMTVKPWDVAAGALICQETNAHLRSFGGGPFDVWEASVVVASSEELYSELKNCLRP